MHNKTQFQKLTWLIFILRVGRRTEYTADRPIQCSSYTSVAQTTVEL